MIDLKLLRTEPERFKEAARRRNVEFDFDGLLQLDEEYRTKLGVVESLRAMQNRASKAIASSSGDEKQAAIKEARQLADALKAGDVELGTLRSKLDETLAWIPNLVHPAAPEGAGDESNKVLLEKGSKRKFDFSPKDHLDVGESLDVIDVARAAKVSGTRFGLLKGRLALLQMALMRFAVDFVASEGFTPVIPPILVREEVLFGMGFFPSEETQAYSIPQDELFLAGTSEAPLAGMHAQETIAPEELPIRYSAFSSCFRREAGTYGKDTRGIIRVHQFEKVEMFVLCDPSLSDEEHLRILDIEERLFQTLGLPYRVVDVCAGDLGAPYSRKFDLEVWLPGAGRWLEVTSCSNAYDYQARRLNIRSKLEGELRFVHTLNGTAVTNRALVAILENFQQADGSVEVPEALHSYAGFSKLERS